MTADGTRGVLLLAIGYGGRQDILHAVNEAVRRGKEVSQEEFSALLFEAARVKTLLVSSAPEYADACRSEAAEAGLVYWGYDIDGVQGGAGISYASMITAYIEFHPERADVRIQCGERTDSCLASVLQYLQENAFTVRAPNEVEAK